jgi:hypothetical protein
MRSFKLERGSSAKQQAVSAGVLLVILGIVLAFLASIPIGIGMATLGLILILDGKFARR